MDGEEPSASSDTNRERLLDAAAQVFARKGYEGSKIMDIVRESGLSTGAVYGRFTSKNDLLRTAVVDRASIVAQLGDGGAERVADMIFQAAMDFDQPLTVDEAMRLEAYVAARREPEVAAAILEAQRTFRASAQPFIDTAAADGTLAPGVDPEAVLFLLRTVQLGLLVSRAAGLPGPDLDAWSIVVARVLGSLGDPDPNLPAFVAPVTEETRPPTTD
jgi:AcrR family transcriptional regulator